MKPKTKDLLFKSWAYCDKHDKSTEFMLQYMQDVAKVDLDCVLGFLINTTEQDRQNWYKQNNKKP